MRALALTHYKQSLQTITMPITEPGDTDLLIRVDYAGVNHADARTRDGEFKAIFPLTLPAVMGGELVGTIIKAGSKTQGFTPGDRVYTYTGFGKSGAFSHYITAPAHEVAHAPTSLSPQESAALPVAALTAWQALITLGKISAGDSVLIHGGAGSVGTAAIQLAHHLGAKITTTASARDADYLTSLGASTVIDYRTQDFQEALAGQEYKLILDTQGGTVLEKSFSLVAPGGIVIGISGPPEPHFARDLGLNPAIQLAIGGLSAKVRTLAKKAQARYRFLFITPSGADLTTIADLADQGIFTPRLGKTYPFTQALTALDDVEKGRTKGKVLLDFTGEDINPEEPHHTKITWAEAPQKTTRVLDQTLAYRELGPLDGTPTLLLTHLGATLDNWDPRIIDPLAQEFRLYAIDLPGLGASTGQVPATIEDMATYAIGFIEALNLGPVNLAGFSLGGFIAQEVARTRPDLVRRLVLTGTGPAGGPGISRTTGPAYIYWDMLRATIARTDAKEFLFFNRDHTGKAAAQDYLTRLTERRAQRDTPVKLSSFQRQLKAITAWGKATPKDLSTITAPTLIANGDKDRMVPTELSQDLQRRIPNSTLIIYPNSGHGGVFQHHQEFIPAMIEHLR